jgi:folate-binding protein YgfZ
MNQSPFLPTIQRLQGPSITIARYFDGLWELPAFYAGAGQGNDAVLAEYASLVSPDGVAIADRSWRSVIELRGRDRQSFLQGMVTNDVAVLTPGQGCRAAMLGSNGHMLADMVVYALEDSLLITVDPRAAGKLTETLDKFLIAEKVMIADVSAKWAIITLAGGGARTAVESLTGSTSLPDTPYANITASVGGASIMVTRSGPRGDVSYDLWAPVDVAPSIWETLSGAGARPVGELALETARIEAADPAWGCELDESVLFPEVELSEALSYTKGCYVGQEIIARIHARGHTNRALRGILFDEGEHSLQQGDLLFTIPDDNGDAKEIGRITSAAVSPRFDGRLLALGYIRKEFNVDGAEVVCRYAHREAYGIVMVPPFG